MLRKLILRLGSTHPYLVQYRFTAFPFATEQSKRMIKSYHQMNYKELIDVYREERDTLPYKDLNKLIMKVLKNTIFSSDLHFTPKMKSEAQKFSFLLEEQVLNNKFTYKDSINYLKIISRGNYSTLPKTYADFICNNIATKLKYFNCTSIADTLELLINAENKDIENVYESLGKKLSIEEINNEDDTRNLIKLLHASCILSPHLPEWKRFIQPIESKLFSSILSTQDIIKAFRITLWFEQTSEEFKKYIGAKVLLLLHSYLDSAIFIKESINILKIANDFVYSSEKNCAYKIIEDNIQLLAKSIVQASKVKKPLPAIELCGYSVLLKARYGNPLYYELLNTNITPKIKDQIDIKVMIQPFYVLTLVGNGKNLGVKLIAQEVKNNFLNILKDIIEFPSTKKPEQLKEIAISKEKFIKLCTFQRDYVRRTALKSFEATFISKAEALSKYHDDAVEYLIKALWSCSVYNLQNEFNIGYNNEQGFFINSIDMINKYLSGLKDVKVSLRTVEMINQINNYIEPCVKKTITTDTLVIDKEDTEIYKILEEYVKDGKLTYGKSEKELGKFFTKEGKLLVLNWNEDYLVDIKSYTSFAKIRKDSLDKQHQPYIEINYHEFLKENEGNEKESLRKFIDGY